MLKQCENMAFADEKQEEIKSVRKAVKEEALWKIQLDLSKITPITVSYTREHAQLVNTVKDQITMRDVLDGKYTIKEMVAQLSIREMAELCVGTERREEGSIVGSASYCVPGAAGDTSSVLKETRGVKNMILADGPAGLRLQRHFKTDKDGNI